MPGADTTPLSRRQFLTGCVGCAAVAMTPMTAGAAESPRDSINTGDGISAGGKASIAAIDRRFAEERPAMEKTVDAVSDLGLDPSGKEPINGTFESALSGMSNTRITFPSGGTFALSGQATVRPNGPVELAGNGCSFVIPPNTETKSFIFVLPSGSQIHDIVLDQTPEGSLQEFGVQTDGTVRVDNVTVKGYAPAKRSSDSGDVDAMFSPIARTPSATVRATNFTAIAGTAAGTHDESDRPPSSPENTLGSPMGIWVGRSNQGTVQLVQPKIAGWSNGIYGGRTKGTVEIQGGSFANNFNAQVRLGGGDVVNGTSLLLDDRQWSKASHPGPFSIGHQGVYAVRVDAKHGDLSDPIQLTNLNIQANSMGEGASLIDFESASGAGIIRNCQITNHLDRPVILGESPEGGSSTNIVVEQCLIGGSSTAPVMQMNNRPQSRVQQTCVTLPGAGPGAIIGAQIGSGVSFGKTCSAGGLADPSAVGSAGNITAMNLSAPNGSISAVTAPQGAQTGGIIKTMVSAVFMIIASLAGLTLGILGLMAILGILGSVLIYLLADE